MQIRFINHASFICEYNGVRLICDPWLNGSAFNDGWDLVADSSFTANDFAVGDYIWFSHEHPDHFSPRVLLDVPAQLRSKLTVLYKQTSDQKVIGFCRKLGFVIQELRDGEEFELGGGLSVLCRRVPLQDSWLLIKSKDCRILNLNDAVIERPAELLRLRKEFGDLDVLFTQFNYAAWRGNLEDTEIRKSDARKKLQVMTQQIENLKPKFTVPFASFSYFSHEENSFTNDASNTPEVALAAIGKTRSIPILLYPGDVWQVGSERDNAAARARYGEAYATASRRPPRRSPPVDLDRLKVEATGYIARIKKANSPHLLRLLAQVPFVRFLGPVEIHLWDLNKTVRFDFEHGLESIASRTARYDLRMSSDSLSFMLKNAWGFDTLTVNGRFAADPAGLKQLVATFGLDALNNSGIALRPAFLRETQTIAFLGRILGRKFWSLRRQVFNTGSRAAVVSARPNQGNRSGVGLRRTS